MTLCCINMFSHYSQRPSSYLSSSVPSLTTAFLGPTLVTSCHSVRHTTCVAQCNFNVGPMNVAACIMHYVHLTALNMQH